VSLWKLWQSPPGNLLRGKPAQNSSRRAEISPAKEPVLMNPAFLQFLRRTLTLLLLLGPLAAGTLAEDASGRVIKVLPLFLDAQGRDALSPSLFDRDAYQAQLRQHPEAVSAIRLDVLWKARPVSSPGLKLRAELRGVGEHGVPQQATLETNVTPGFFRHWTSLTLGGDKFKTFGTLVAWRVSLWKGDQLLGEQKSFLW
jgi:hypothetical protein